MGLGWDLIWDLDLDLEGKVVDIPFDSSKATVLVVLSISP